MHNVTLKHIYVIIDAIEKQYILYILRVYL